MRKYFCLFFFLFLLLLPSFGQSQNEEQEASENEYFRTLNYRFAGPFRGGRSTAVAGHASHPFTFYMGATGGGVWKTTDAGQHWDNLSDGQIKCGSIGAITVAPSASNVIFVGTGSDSPRGNVSAGIGMYKSEDGGKNWTHVGLDRCGQIGDVVIHPRNPEIVYAAALGNVFGKNRERGVYRTNNGGQHWEQVLFLNDSTGAVDLAMDPLNPKVLYAGMWRTERKPWTLIDGGHTGGLYKTTDGGAHWKKITNGLPTGLIGKIGIAISPVNNQRIWVIQQAAEEEQGGVYRSDDGGESFERINRDHKLRQRGWYYSRIFADPQDENTVYVTNTGFYQSIDGGESFKKSYPVPHGDCHDTWINPEHPNIMINSNDGGATITLNGGATWSTQNNQPTSEFYRLTLDNQFPYRLYAGQQDNTTISIPSRSSGGLDPKQHWYSVGGGESADVAVHPLDPNIVYATTYSGIITRVNLKTDEVRYVGAYPHYTEGTAQRDLKYRWQWNFPIRFSKHNSGVLYHTSNYVHKSTDEGQSWQRISPDLTQAIDAYFGIPGGPIQHDATGVEVYGTIFAFEESPFDPRVLWAGSDDGLIHITRDGGASWMNITPPDMPGEGTVNSIELSPNVDGRAYVAVYRYRDNDFRPYIFHTNDFGRNWRLLTKGNNGIPEDHFVRVVQEDPLYPGLLYAGTEYGVYLSSNNGESWESFQLNLPHTPVTDMELRGDELVLSTQGRGFWILEGLDALRQTLQRQPKGESVLFTPGDTYRSNVNGTRGRIAPPVAPYRANIHFYLAEQDTGMTIQLHILDGEQQLIRSYSTDAKEKDQKLDAKAGMNRFQWDLHYPRPDLLKDLVMMDMRYPGVGPMAPTGIYKVKLMVGEKTLEESFRLKKDPRWEADDDDLAANFKLAHDISGLLSRSQQQLRELRSARAQLNGFLDTYRLGKTDEEVLRAGQELIHHLTEVEDMIYQRQIETSQDEINYPRKFTNHLIRLYRVVISQNDRPSGGEQERWTDLQEDYKPFENAYRVAVREKLPAFLDHLKEKSIPFIPVGK